MRFLALLLLALPLQAEIVETYHFADLLDHVEEETLLVVDIDNTLIVPAQQLGSTPWGWAHIKRLEGEGKRRNEAKEETNRLMKQIFANSQALPCEPGIPEVIQRLQERGIPVLGLTLRIPEWGFATADGLFACGIDLKRSNLREGVCLLSSNPRLLFVEGTLFVDDMGDKGKALAAFLKESHYIPKKVVFIDDRKKNLQRAESALKQMGLPFVGIWYRGADAHYGAFRQDLADVQLRVFQSLLSDEEAQKLIDAGFYHE